MCSPKDYSNPGDFHKRVKNAKSEDETATIIWDTFKSLRLSLQSHQLLCQSNQKPFVLTDKILITNQRLASDNISYDPSVFKDIYWVI
jgi:hypothetical protein